MELTQFDKLFAISDLHMGGKPGFQILRETERLENFIFWVGDAHPNEEIALVLNGDVIDTLAEEEVNGYIAMDNAVSIVQRIMEDDSFKGIWQALKKFVANKDHSLIFILGNHDLELALPTVQQMIIEYLVGKRSEIRARIEFSTIGAGYTCQIGDSRVFCTHGNEVDPWNYTRYEDLSKLARRLNAARPFSSTDWEPNAGTKMVKDVMNEVKKTYQWIDLLKPEKEAAVGVLLTLDPSQLGKINKLPQIIGKQRQGSREANQRLSGDGFHQPDAPTTLQADYLLGKNVMQGLKGLSPDTHQTADELLLATEKTFKNKQSSKIPANETLGTGQLFWDKLTGWITGVGEDEALRKALKDWLSNDESFSLDNKDETYKEITPTVGKKIDFVITGHTHLERAIPMENGRYYFNCGTWIRLLGFSSQMLKNKKSFQPIYKVLKDGSMAAIDQSPLVKNQSSVVSISKQANGKAVGKLAHVKGGVAGKKIRLDFIKSS
jgi:UDP-2,3-diacylglucosamine pyrophosphatase LpxH